MSYRNFGTVPDFGFNPQILFEDELSDGTLTGAAFDRLPGGYVLLVTGTFAFAAGSPEVDMILEGSNDGTNWHTVAQTTAGDRFTADGEAIALSNDSQDATPAFRWDQYRVRTVEVVGGTWTLDVSVQTVGRDAQKFLDTEQFTRNGAATNGDTRTRRSGTRCLTVQAVFSGVALGALTGYRAVLQLSADGGTTWVNAAEGTVTGNGSVALTHDGSQCVELGGSSTWRTRVEDIGTAGGGEDYTVDFSVGSDDGDWFPTDDLSQTGGGSGSVSGTLLRVQTTQTAVDADNIDVNLQVVDFAGNPIGFSVPLQVGVWDTEGAGLIDLAATAQISAVSTGTAIAGLGTNRVALSTDASGAATYRVDDSGRGGAETVFSTVVPGGVPPTTAGVVVEASEESLAYA